MEDGEVYASSPSQSSPRHSPPLATHIVPPELRGHKPLNRSIFLPIPFIDVVGGNKLRQIHLTHPNLLLLLYRPPLLPQTPKLLAFNFLGLCVPVKCLGVILGARGIRGAWFCSGCVSPPFVAGFCEKTLTIPRHLHQKDLASR